MYFEIDNCKTEVEKETLPIRNSYFHTGRKIGNAIPHDFWLCGISGLWFSDPVGSPMPLISVKHFIQTNNYLTSRTDSKEKFKKNKNILNIFFNIL